jgi:hypothetical protein
MKTFHCTHCDSLVFFENVSCLNCGHVLAYLPDQGLIAAMSQRRDRAWLAEGDLSRRQTYRLCANYTEQHVCNWAIPSEDLNSLCRSCRLTRVIPDLTPGGKEAWARLETAKRRLVQSLLRLQLPLAPKSDTHPEGVAFEFLQDSTQANGDSQRVLTGHDNGLITINIAEADDVEREKQRQRQHEPYRTLLGHFRHEIGHYYWDLLIRDSDQLRKFRTLFGDERADYGQALKRHYRDGPPADWAERYISTYATSHPWEDWAESWAHFLHMADALETANETGLVLRPRRANEPMLPAWSTATSIMDAGFKSMIERWLPLTYVMNNLSRGLGLSDNYPFVLTATTIEKLHFIYDTINASRHRVRGSKGSGVRRAARAMGIAGLVAGAAVAIVALAQTDDRPG